VLRRLTAARVPQNASRAYALCGILLHYSFVVAGTLRVPLSQPQNRRIQPERYAKRTHGVSSIKLVEKNNHLCIDIIQYYCIIII